MAKRRIDALLAERGLAGSRTTAAASVRAGRVRIGRHGPVVDKPSQLVAPDADLYVSERPRFVSRGGIKLENALEELAIDVRGVRCLDIGASTGGFTDCLLQRGAELVIALDVAHGQLDWGLRNDRRVIVIERLNARGLTPADIPWPPSLITVDVSFISLPKLLPALARCLPTDGEIVALVKPQFELGPGRVGRGGVVREGRDRREALRAVARAASETGLAVSGVAPSGLPGPKGNRETFIRQAHAPGGAELSGASLEEAIEEAEP